MSRPERPTARQLLTIADVVEEFGFVSEYAVRALIVHRELPFRRLGRRYYFLRHELEAHFQALPGCSAEEAKATATERAAA